MIDEGHFTIPTYVFLKPEERRKLDVLVREQGVDLPSLLTELLSNHLAGFPDVAPTETTPVNNDTSSLLRQRRAELQRLRNRVATSGDTMPGWLAHYISELEVEISQLERKH